MSADKKSLRNSGCTGKARHETFDAAARQLAKGKAVNKSGYKRVKLGVYECSFCGGFHIGHKLRKLK
jgi:hypothetical protein